MTLTSKTARASIAALATAGLALAFAAPAMAASQKVRSACKDDYFRLCPSYEPDSAKMRQCMRQNGKRLSSRCVDALVDAGEIRRRR